MGDSITPIEGMHGTLVAEGSFNARAAVFHTESDYRAFMGPTRGPSAQPSNSALKRAFARGAVLFRAAGGQAAYRRGRAPQPVP